MIRETPLGNLSHMISVNAIDNRWSEISNLLACLVDERLNLKNIYDKIVSGEWHLWVAFDDDQTIYSVAVTCFVYYPLVTNVRVVLLSGEHEKWADIIRIFEEFAKINDCHSVEIKGRKGWERVLRKRGYESKSVTLRKRIK